MKNGLARAANAPSAQASDDFLNRQLVTYDRVEFHLEILQHAVQGFCLAHRPGEAIEQKSTPASQAGGTLAYHGDDDFVGYELSSLHGI